MSEFIQNCFIELNNVKSSYIDLFPNDDYKFGILRVDMVKKDVTKNPVSILFTIDHSASMNDTCSDGKTKLEHVKYTLKKIFEELSNKNCDIEVCVLLFDNKCKLLIDFVKINESVLPELVSKIQNIREQGSTNINKALQETQSIISNIQNRKCYHIFMTDGEANEGECDPYKLLEMVNNKITNIFVGFGIDHDSTLLRVLCKNGQNNEYKFVDQIEKSGMVYGEIIHNILYCLIDNPVLKINFGEIYDWKNNSWVEKIFIQDLVSETEKIFHIRTKTPNVIYGEILRRENDAEINIMKVEVLPELVDNNKNILSNDLTPFMFRQKTQEFMYEAIELMEKGKVKNWNNKNVQFSQNINDYDFNLFSLPIKNVKPKKQIHIKDNSKEKIKNEIKSFIEKMMSYTKEEKDQEYNSMIKLLCDDLYICYKTINTNQGIMYTASRQTSQGNQTICRATQLNDIDDELEEEEENIFQKFKLNENIFDTPYCTRSASETINLFSQTS